MAKTSTQVMMEDRIVKTSIGPRKSTVDFLKQLARVYNYNRLAPELGGLVLN